MSRTTGAAWRELTLEEHMELVGGPVDGTVFKNEADRELAWRHHYDHLMERRGGQAGDRVGILALRAQCRGARHLPRKGLAVGEARPPVREGAPRDHLSRGARPPSTPVPGIRLAPVGGGVDEADGAGAQRGSDRAPRGTPGDAGRWTLRSRFAPPLWSTPSRSASLRAGGSLRPRGPRCVAAAPRPWSTQPIPSSCCAAGVDGS